MKCLGKFKFRGIERKDGGSFTDNNGRVVNFKESYAIKLDEILPEGSVIERLFKIPVDSPLVPQLSKLEVYQDVTLEFDVLIYRNSTKLVPIAIKQ